MRKTPSNSGQNVNLAPADQNILMAATARFRAGLRSSDSDEDSVYNCPTHPPHCPLAGRQAQPRQAHLRERFEEFAGLLKALKGRFILSLNDLPEVRETFAGFRFAEVKTTYTIGSTGAAPERAEVLISNWPLAVTA